MTEIPENKEEAKPGEPFRMRDLAGRVKALTDIVVRLERKLKERTKDFADTLDKSEDRRLLFYSSIGFTLGLIVGILISRDKDD